MDEIFATLGEHGALLSNGLTFLLGLFFGHRLSLGRDRRKELNDAISPVRDALLRMRGTRGQHLLMPGAVEFDRITCRMSWWQRRRLIASIARYKAARERLTQENRLGEPVLVGPDQLKPHIEELLDRLRLR